MKTILIFLLVLCCLNNASAQKSGYISGKVLEIDEHGHFEPMEFVNVYYAKSQEGLITGSNSG